MATTEESGAETSQMNVDALSAEELRGKLEELKLSVRGGKAALAERLRRALTGSASKSATKAGKSGVMDAGNESEKEERDKAADINLLSLDELKTRLRAMGLKTMGKKAVLRERLKAAIEESDESDDDDLDEDENDDEDEVENNDDDESEDDDGEEEKKRKKKMADKRSEKRSVNAVRGTDRNARHVRQVTLSFKDVEDALETFSGDGSESIHRWLSNLEETAELCQWTEAQQVIYAKSA